MTKVNYFEVTPSDSKEEKVVLYARSKKEALSYATEDGVEATIDGVREMNFKEELSKDHTEKDLYDIRKKSTGRWKEEAAALAAEQAE